MAWYGYCVAERQAFPALARHRKASPIEGLEGLSGRQTFLFPAGELAVIVSETVPGECAAIDQGSQRDHARVVAACFERACAMNSTVLPFRFGTVFAHDEALRRVVRSNQRHFLSNVERLRGKAEMHLKMLVDDGCAKETGGAALSRAGGQEFLSTMRESATRQRERQSRARALSLQMHRMFLPLAEEISCKRMESGKMLLDIAHLIDQRMVERYQNKYGSATLQMKECRMQLSGPWPPYHFVQRGAGAQQGAA